MRLVFMGTPQFALPTLKKILSSSHQLVAVLTQPDKPAGRGEKVLFSPAKRTALEHHISVHQPEVLQKEVWLNRISALEADAFVVVAYGKILPPWLFKLPRYGAINLHASLLPQYRGAAPINWALANGETITGVTTMKIESGLDTGDILLQEKVEIRPHDYASDLHDRLSHVGADLMLKTLDMLENSQLSPIAQNPELATYAPILKKSDGELVWDKTAEELYNRVRAFNPWPGTYSYLEGSMLRIWRAAPIEIPCEYHTPGALFHSRSHGAVVVCRQGLLQLHEVQLESRKKISAIDFLHGIRLAENRSILLGR